MPGRGKSRPELGYCPLELLELVLPALRERFARS
jgi:hypothetical protein